MPSYVGNCNTIATHDAFCYVGLGRSAALVVEALQDGPKSVKELVACTVRSEKTLRQALKRMQEVRNPHNGDALSLVVQYEARWEYLAPDLDEVARFLGTAGYASHRREKLERQRRSYHDYLRRRDDSEGDSTARSRHAVRPELPPVLVRANDGSINRT